MLITPNNKDNLRLWEAGLRSGEFPQTQDCLHDGVGYCCLGVACVLAARAGVIPPMVQKTNCDGETFHYFAGEDANLPQEVALWLGLGSTNPQLEFLLSEGRSELITAQDANDSCGKSFIEIADALKHTFDL